MASPLADKLRPRTLEDVVGQSHLLAQGQVLRSIIEGGTIPNMIFYLSLIHISSASRRKRNCPDHAAARGFCRDFCSIIIN